MSQAPKDLVAKAQEAFDQRRWEEAQQAYERVLEQAPQYVPARMGLADLQTVQGKLKAAATTLAGALDDAELPLEVALNLISRILELDPYAETIYLKRIDLLYGNGRADEAVVQSHRLAQHFQDQDRGEEAIKLLVRAFQLQPQNLDLINVLAEAYLAQGQLREATGLFRQILPTFLEQEDYDRAAQILRRMTVINPQDTQTPLELGDIYVKLGRHQEADQQYRAVLRQDINNREALLRIAEVSQMRQQFRDAAMVFDRLLRADPEDLEARHGLGKVYKMQGMPQDAVKHLLMAGLASVEAGDKERASQCFSAVLELDPNNRIATAQMKVLA